MDHAATGDLQPAGVLADAATLTVTEHAGHVDFSGWLSEREVRGPQPHAQIFLEESAQEPLQHGFEVREVHAFIDDETLDLMEHRRVGHVVVHAVDAARHDHRER